jgi:hypothetical protein
MIGKRLQFHDETWQQLRLLASESMKSFQELADEAFNDLLRKHGRPANLKEALRRSAGESAEVIPRSGASRARPDERDDGQPTHLNRPLRARIPRGAGLGRPS